MINNVSILADFSKKKERGIDKSNASMQDTGNK